MHLSSRVKLPKSRRAADAEAVTSTEAMNLPHVIWYKDPGLRKLYALTAIIIISSATNGYDG
jgi:hypothetical protein